jgi:hypothetical protein
MPAQTGMHMRPDASAADWPAAEASDQYFPHCRRRQEHICIKAHLRGTVLTQLAALDLPRATSRRRRA